MMSALWYRDLVRRQWWLLVLCALAGLVGGFTGGVRFFPVYQATAELQASVRTTDQSANTIGANDRVVRTLALDATSAPLLQRVAAKYAGLSESHLASEVTSIAVANTSALTITVQDSNPAQAALLANAVSDELVRYWQVTLEQENTASQLPLQNAIAATSGAITAYNTALKALGNPPSNRTRAASLQAELTALQQQYQQQFTALTNLQVAEASQSFLLSVVQRATPPDSPLRSRLAVDSGAGGLFGALCGLVLIAGFGLMRRRLRSAESVAKLSGWPVLVEFERVRALRSTPDGALVADDTLGEAATSLIRSIDFLGIDRPLRVIAVTSPSTSGASSAIASSLALYLSAGGRRTLLVDARFVNGWQARQFGVPLVPGLSNAALAAKQSAPDANVTLEGYMHEPTRMHAPFLRVLPSGSGPPNPGRLLASRPLGKVLSAIAASQAEMIVIDAPPLVSAAQASALTRVADGILPVVDLNDTTIDHLLRLQATLADAGASVLGCVVNLRGSGGRTGARGSRAEVDGDPAGTIPASRSSPAPPAPATFVPPMEPQGMAQDLRAKLSR